MKKLTFLLFFCPLLQAKSPELPLPPLPLASCGCKVNEIRHSSQISARELAESEPTDWWKLTLWASESPEEGKEPEWKAEVKERFLTLEKAIKVCQRWQGRVKALALKGK